MKNTIFGFIVGVMLAVGTTAGAQSFGYFVTSGQMATTATPDFQGGYAAGVSDTVELFRTLQENSKGVDWTMMKRFAGCLDAHGQNSSALQEFAVRMWKLPDHDPRTNAATLLLASACEQ